MKKQIDPLGFFNSVITDDFIEGLLEAEGVVHREGIFKAQDPIPKAYSREVLIIRRKPAFQAPVSISGSK